MLVRPVPHLDNARRANQAVQVTLNRTLGVRILRFRYYSGCSRRDGRAALGRLGGFFFMELAKCADFGPKASGAEYHQNRSNAAADDCEDRAKIMRNDAGFYLAEFVRTGDEDRVHGRDAAPYVFRRTQLHERVADDNTDVIARAAQSHRCERDPEVFREAEDHDADSEPGDAP